MWYIETHLIKNMIYKSIEELPSSINFINTGKYETENQFPLLKIYREINISYARNLDKKKKYLTINPLFYFENLDKINLDLMVFSVDRHNSHLQNILKYIKSNKMKKLEYKKEYFKKFLFDHFTNRKINHPNFVISIILKLLSYFKLYFKDNRIYYKENLHKDYYLGEADNYCYLPISNEFKNQVDEICSNLSDEKSKRIFLETVFSKPSIVWKNYYDLLFEHEHYQDYLNFDEANIINLGVANGFELPFFLTQNINKIINVDPTGYETLDDYVKIFTKQFEEKNVFDTHYLYKPKKLYVKKTENYKSTTLAELIKSHNLNKNIIIKSDIEGSEVDLVNELKTVIPKLRPQLALSIYHFENNLRQSLEPKNAHVVLLPKKLMNYCNNYNFYINHYTYNRRETVIFCIPKEKVK